nr:heme-binding protein [Pseudomonas carnis]
MTKSIATASINRETAVALIDAAIAAARTIGIPAAVAVVDATGNLRAFERTDDAPFLTVDVGVWGAMEPKTNVSLTTSAQSLLPRQFPRLIFRTFRKYC